jgi:hypothetical protein
MIESVKLKDVDDSIQQSDGSTTALAMGGRTLEIKVKDRSPFTTPTRPISVPELEAMHFLTFRGSLDGHLGAVQIDIRGERYQEFLKKNGVNKAIKRKMVSFADRTCCFENFVLLHVPPLRPSEIGIFKMYFEMQTDIPTLDYISMPQIASNDENVYKGIVQGWITEAEKLQKGVVPRLSMKDDLEVFKKKLKILADMAKTGEIRIIDVIYANPKNYLLQYVELWKNKEIEAIINCSDVPFSEGRLISPGLRETPIIELQRWGIDTIAPSKFTLSPKALMKMISNPPPKNLQEIGDFSWACHPGGAFIDDDLWQKIPSENVHCDCKLCLGKNQPDLVKVYSVDDIGALTYNGMEKAARLHDHLSSQSEYSVIRDRIKSREMAGYLSEISDFREIRLKI